MKDGSFGRNRELDCGNIQILWSIGIHGSSFLSFGQLILRTRPAVSDGCSHSVQFLYNLRAANNYMQQSVNLQTLKRSVLIAESYDHILKIFKNNAGQSRLTDLSDFPQLTGN